MCKVQSHRLKRRPSTIAHFYRSLLIIKDEYRMAQQAKQSARDDMLLGFN